MSDIWDVYHAPEIVFERNLIINFAKSQNYEVYKLQGLKDDGGCDGLLKSPTGEIYPIEVRRKGFANHFGQVTNFPQGWDTWCLRTGIYLNESTIRKYIGCKFFYLVEIKCCKPRATFINAGKVNELLAQPMKYERSTNSGIWQSVKSVPLNWFGDIEGWR